MSASRSAVLVSALISALAPLLAACGGGSPQPSADGSEAPPPPETMRDCPSCGIERVVETLEYEPRPVWTSPGAAPRQLAALPAESSIPPETTLAERRPRKLAA
jgi:hypothetical protein